jgi:hypothetical protein
MLLPIFAEQSYRPTITVHYIEARDDGQATDMMSDHRFEHRQPFLTDGNTVWLGGPDQMHEQLWEDALAAGHDVPDHAHRGAYDFGGGGAVSFFTNQLKPEWKEEISKALGGTHSPEHDEPLEEGWTASWQKEENPEPLFFATTIPEGRWNYGRA